TTQFYDHLSHHLEKDSTQLNRLMLKDSEWQFLKELIEIFKSFDDLNDVDYTINESDEYIGDEYIGDEYIEDDFGK
ncbi:9336_t:CDS:2, partial [Diversispora eburnea]